MTEQKEKFAQLQKVIDEHKDQKGALMPVLQAAQNIFDCVSLDVQEYIADALGTTLSEVYGVATFYSQFSLQPKGKYVIGVCMGTACYVRGGNEVLRAMKDKLGIDVGGTTPDRQFSLEVGRCFGACGMAPVLMVNDDLHQRVKPAKLGELLEKYRAPKQEAQP